nr:hypothetical protein [Tanacetum cinerariifolium]
YELFKEQIEAVQDEQVKILSDKVAGFDVKLIGMALHLDDEIGGDVASRHLYLFVAMVLLIEPFSAENLVGEASTSGLPAAVAATTTLSTTFVQASSVLPIPASDHEVVDTEPQV